MPSERIVFESGEWMVDLATRELRINGLPVSIGSRAFDIVEALVRSAGELVTKDDLVRSAWPGVTIVEDATIRMHISAIRKALGADRMMLQTVAGSGYRLLGNWIIRQRHETDLVGLAGQVNASRHSFSTNVPIAAGELVGREAAVRYLGELVTAYRVVTLTGPGGIGKTVLATEVARRLFPKIECDVYLIELVSLSDPLLVSSAAATALDLRLGGNEISPASVSRAIGNRRVLLVFDNCEHVIDAAAELIECIVRFCPNAAVLATSREVLRIEGEFIYRVPPLDVPPEHQDENENVLEHSAVQLFVTRAGELQAEIATCSDSLPAVTTIVRRLDGIPLAIEFAAARASTFGVQEVSERLDNRFALLVGGRRTALPRHQTLRAALDWSYELLSGYEQRLLCRLAVFPSGFTFEAARAMMATASCEQSSVTEAMAGLIDKSLVSPESVDPVERWRLLETTRAYALEKLNASGDAEAVSRRHAEFYLALFAELSSENQSQTVIRDLRGQGREIDNLRAALNWAFSSNGDKDLGVALAAAAADFWSAMFLLTEACEWAGRALEHIGRAAGSRTEMILQCSLGLALIYTNGMITSARVALTRALMLAHDLEDFDYQQRVTHDLWLFSARSAASKEALALARQYEEIAGSRDAQSRAVADWIVGIPLTYMAAHDEAAERLQRAIEHYPAERRKLDLARFGADLRASASAHLTVNLLSLGRVDAASQVALFSIAEARSTGHPTALCISLAWAAGFIFLSLGELETAEQFGDELIHCAYKSSMRPFYAAGLCLRGSLAAKRGDPCSGIDSLRTGLSEMEQASYLLFHPFYTAELASALGATSRFDEAQAEVDEALNLSAEIEYRWFVPELLRVKGELLRLRRLEDAAEVLFQRSKHHASEQRALYWEFCSAASLADLMRSQRRFAEARSVLGEVYERLTEGFETPRINRAKMLLEEMCP